MTKEEFLELLQDPEVRKWIYNAVEDVKTEMDLQERWFRK